MLPQLNSITPVNMFKNGGQELHVFIKECSKMVLHHIFLNYSLFIQSSGL